MSRRNVIIILLILSLAAAGGWLLHRRPAPVDMATYVPESALGYMEVNNWPELVRNLTATENWKRPAPSYGIPEEVNTLGQIGWLSRFTAGNDLSIISQSQFALVITGLEVRGDEVKPQLALIIETHAGDRDLDNLIGRRLPQFAERFFDKTISEKGDYSGVPVAGYRPAGVAGNSDRGLYSARIEGEWIIANNMDSLSDCIDTRLGRAPSIASNFYLQKSRPLVDRNREVFGFITAEGVGRLLRFGAFIISNATLRETGVIETLQDVLTDLASRSAAGIAFGSTVEVGGFADRYEILLKPEFLERIRPLIKPINKKSNALKLIPGSVSEATIFRIERPGRTIDEIEKAVSARIGAAQSFLLHQFLLGAHESLIGLNPEDSDYSAIGNEIAGFSFTGESEDRIWVVEILDSGRMSAIAENFLRKQGATIRKERIDGIEVINSSDPRLGSAALIDGYIALGNRAQLAKLIYLRREDVKTSKPLSVGDDFDSGSLITGYSSVAQEAGEMMTVISKWAGSGQVPSRFPVGIPFSVSSTSLNVQGIYIETHSPFGLLPFFISIIDGASNAQ